MKINKEIKHLKEGFKGDLLFDELSKIVYSTDASAYRAIPLGVALPKDKEDIRELVAFANQNNLSVISCGAGTTRAGQVVGDGRVGDVSRYMSQVLELNVEERWVRVA